MLSVLQLRQWEWSGRQSCFFILYRAILVILIVRYKRKVTLAFIVSTISRWRINASAAQCSTGALLRMLRHGGSQPCKEEGASHPALREKNAEAFLNPGLGPHFARLLTFRHRSRYSCVTSPGQALFIGWLGLVNWWSHVIIFWEELQ